MKKKYLKAYIGVLEQEIKQIKSQPISTSTPCHEYIPYEPHDEEMTFMCFKCKTHVKEIHHLDGVFECICHECRKALQVLSAETFAELLQQDLQDCGFMPTETYWLEMYEMGYRKLTKDQQKLLGI